MNNPAATPPAGQHPAPSAAAAAPGPAAEPAAADAVFVEVLRGELDETELAAVIAGLLATASSPAPAPAPASYWNDLGHRLGVRRAQPHAWRWSTRH